MLIQPCHQIEEITSKDLLSLSPSDREELLDNAVMYWRQKGFPYRQMNGQDVEKQFHRVLQYSAKNVITGDRIEGSTAGLDLANSFHPHIWHAVRWGHHKSPIDHFNDDPTLKKLLERAISLWPNNKAWSAYVVRGIFRIYSGGRVSNFRPMVSKAIIDRFSNSGDTVLDFCSGYGGRLLGAMCLDRHYIGIDPSDRQIASNQEMYHSISRFSKCTAEFHEGCAEEVMPKLETNSTHIVFTSPPYYNREKYNKEQNQSYIRHGNYENWKSDFLSQVTSESKRILKQGGYFIINISNIRNYDVANDFEEMASQHFKLVNKLELSMSARPLHMKNGIPSKSEPIFVFQKK